MITQTQLNAAERRIAQAAVTGQPADLRGTHDGHRAPVRAELLSELATDTLLGLTVKDTIHVIGGRVTGRLDLAGAHIRHALRFVDCQFDDRVDLSGAHARMPIEWAGGQVAALVADRFESTADFILSGVTLLGTVTLHWARLRGDLRLTNCRLRQRHAVALDGRDLRVEGSVFLDGPRFHAEGTVSLWSAHIGGSLDCRQAHFDNSPNLSIDAANMVLRGEMLCEDGFTADGEVCLERADVERLRATGGTFASVTRYALHADAMTARSGVYLDKRFHATGTVRMVGADITGELCCTAGRFDNPGGRSLDAERLIAGDVYLDRCFQAHGEVRLAGARITRQLNCTRGTFVNEAGYALDADGIHCGGAMFLNEGFHARGEVRLMGAAVADELNCTDGQFDNDGGYALNADGMTTPGNVYLNGRFRAIGEVRLARATIGRQLMLSGATVKNPDDLAVDLSGVVCHGDVLCTHGFHASGEVRIRGAHVMRDLDLTTAELAGDDTALDARGLRVDGRMTWRLGAPASGEVDLSFATVSRLDDTLTSWPATKFVLNSFDYRIAPAGEITAEQRIDWLRTTKTHSPDAYQQLAKAYRLNGDEASAQKVAIARQRDLRRLGNLPAHSRAWNWFLDVTSGYGYRLHRPLLALLVLAIAGSVIYWQAE